MRYILYIFTLGLVFTAGMLVGNFYIPAQNTSQAVAVSVPDIDHINPAIDQSTEQQARRNIAVLTQALSSCPVVVEAERDRLFKEIALFLALQDFKLKKAIYEAEIAKNSATGRPTAQFSEAAAQYSTAKTYAENLADEFFPPVIASPTQASTDAAVGINPALPEDSLAQTTAVPSATVAQPTASK